MVVSQLVSNITMYLKHVVFIRIEINKKQRMLLQNYYNQNTNKNTCVYRFFGLTLSFKLCRMAADCNSDQFCLILKFVSLCLLFISSITLNSNDLRYHFKNKKNRKNWIVISESRCEMQFFKLITRNELCLKYPRRFRNKI